MATSEHETGAVHWCAEALRWQGEAKFWQERAQRLEELNVGLGAQVRELEGQVAALKQTASTLSQALYGDSSEKGPAPGAQPHDGSPSTGQDGAGDDGAAGGDHDGGGGGGEGWW